MHYCRKIFVVTAMLSMAGHLFMNAQVTASGFSKKNEHSTEDRNAGMEKKYLGGAMMKADMGKAAYPFKKWEGGTGNHDFSKKMWQNPRSGSAYSTDSRYETSVLQYDKMPMKWYANNDKEAAIENLDVMREMVRASKFKNANVYQYPVDTYEKIHTQIDKMSMQDINRYNFRRNHSSDPGLSKEGVGGERQNWMKQGHRTVSSSQ